MNKRHPLWKRGERLLRQRCRKLFGNTCAICRRVEPSEPTELTRFHCHHILGRGKHVALRLETTIFLCRDHHEDCHKSGGKDRLLAYIGRQWPEWFKILEALRIPNNSRFTQSDLEEAVNKLEAM